MKALDYVPSRDELESQQIELLEACDSFDREAVQAL